MKTLKQIVNSAFESLKIGALAAVASAYLIMPTIGKAEEKNILTVFNPSISFSFNANTFEVKDSPAIYGQIPAHPDDLAIGPCKTREVKLAGVSYTDIDTSLGIDISPIPLPYLDLIKIGYVATFFNTSYNETREGISNMEWYEYGAYAGTYSRISLPTVENSLILSLTVPVPLSDTKGLLFRSGISYDSMDSSIEGGWDRYYSEEAMVKDNVKLKGTNPFVSISFYSHPDNNGKVKYNKDSNFEIFLQWKQNSLEGTTPNGDVKIGGNNIGLGIKYNF
jgi:hypothetical protein